MARWRWVDGEVARWRGGRISKKESGQGVVARLRGQEVEVLKRLEDDRIGRKRQEDSPDGEEEAVAGRRADKGGMNDQRQKWTEGE